MGMQLIFVVETNKACKSDWIYIKDTVNHFYQYETGNIKLTDVYMNGKGRYKSKEKEIQEKISSYQATSSTNVSQVIYCFDCDEYDIKPEDQRFLQEAQDYCTRKAYEFVWFCKDIEQVYLGRKVADKQKKKEAAKFKEKKMINQISSDVLFADRYRNQTSNILKVLDKYPELKRK